MKKILSSIILLVGLNCNANAFEIIINNNISAQEATVQRVRLLWKNAQLIDLKYKDIMDKKSYTESFHIDKNFLEKAPGTSVLIALYYKDSNNNEKHLNGFLDIGKHEELSQSDKVIINLMSKNEAFGIIYTIRNEVKDKQGIFVPTKIEWFAI